MALRKRTDAYWQKRANERLTRSERLTQQYMRKLRAVYAEARRNTTKQLQEIYAAYYKGDDGFDMQSLRSIVPSGEIKRFLDEMKRLGLNTNLPDNYKGRVTRLELLNEQLKMQANKAAIAEQIIDANAFEANYTDSFYRAGYDVSRGIGSTPLGFSNLDSRTVEKVLNEKFEGKNYSERIWKNSDIFAHKLQKTLAIAIANGQSIQKTARDIRVAFNTQQYYAERLIRTESNHFHNEAEIESYKDMGFEYYEFLATLDNRTSEICQEMDGKKFKVADGIPGENIPPLHPNCRSTIVPYFKDFVPETRIYRDANGRNQYAYNLPYGEWKKRYAASIYDGRHDKSAEISITMHNKIKPILGGEDVFAQIGVKKGRSMSHKKAIDGTNPHFERGTPYARNCQRCVPVYEMRRRGYDVSAAPKPKYNFIFKANEAFVDPKTGKFPTCVYRPKSDSRKIINEMKQFPDGARFAVSITRRGRAGHVFIAEKINGKIIFSDPQPNRTNTSGHFETANKIGYFRMDNLPFNNNKLVLRSIIERKGTRDDRK